MEAFGWKEPSPPRWELLHKGGHKINQRGTDGDEKDT